MCSAFPTTMLAPGAILGSRPGRPFNDAKVLYRQDRTFFNFLLYLDSLDNFHGDFDSRDNFGYDWDLDGCDDRLFDHLRLTGCEKQACHHQSHQKQGKLFTHCDLLLSSCLFDESDLLVTSISRSYKKFYRFHLLFYWYPDFTDFSDFFCCGILGASSDQPPAPALIQMAAMIARMTRTATAIQTMREDDNISPAIFLATEAANSVSEGGLYSTACPVA